MYIIAVYDINEKRVNRMLKLCRQYLNWIQNSVFEGDLPDVKLKELKHRAGKIMKDEDSLIFFKSPDGKWLEKEVMGKDKNPLDTII